MLIVLGGTKDSLCVIRTPSKVAWKISCAQWQTAQSEVAMGKVFLNTLDCSSDWPQGSPAKALSGKLDSILGGGTGNMPEPRGERLKDIPQRAPLAVSVRLAERECPTWGKPSDKEQPFGKQRTGETPYQQLLLTRQPAHGQRGRQVTAGASGQLPL